MKTMTEPGSELQEVREDRPVPCEFITGKAGSGKTYEVVRRNNEDSSWGLLCATTGIAAVNLNAVTINSILKYFDTLSMRDAYLTGALTKTLHKLARVNRRLVIDEASMMDGMQLDYLYRATIEANRFKDVIQPFGITLVGDFAQLPPVRAKWAFEAKCWGQFAGNTIKLTKVWRQGEGPFLDALNHAREGRGRECAEVLDKAGVQWHSCRITEFEGTTILPKNDMVSRHNDVVLDTVPRERFQVKSRRWGMQRSEWGQNKRTGEWGIPPTMDLKIGAYVMILTNKRDFSQVNGDCGYVREYDREKEVMVVELVRTGKMESVARVIQDVSQFDEPGGFKGKRIDEEEEVGWLAEPHFKEKSGKYVLGQVERFPLRLAYASTCHKAQGLTLDRCQVDLRDRFFAENAMGYVALSRVRTLDGLRLVVGKESFVRQINMDPKVREWL